MDIQVTVNGLDGVDLGTVIGTHRVYEGDGEYSERGRTLGDLVAEKLAERIMGATEYDVRMTLVDKARTELVAVIRKKAEPIITEALAGPIRLTNTYGEMTGAETTLTALIVAEAKKTLGGDRNDYGRGKTLAQRIIADQVGAAFMAELSSVIQAEKDKVVAAVRASAAELIADAIKKGIGR